MRGLSALSWHDFSNKYLLSTKSSKDISHIPSSELANGLDKYLEDIPELNLSIEAKDSLKNYAFRKYSQEHSKQARLTNAVASNIFESYHKNLSQLRMEYTASNVFKKPEKPSIPKGLARLASISCSVLEKYLEPKYKAITQDLLKQSQNIQQVIKQFFKQDTKIDFKKVMTLELLAKKLAYLNPSNGERFYLPFEGRMVEYEVEELHLWMGMNAYGLRPVDRNEKAQPILIFSGTRLSISNRGSMATIASDFDPRGVGYIAYNSGKGIISNWLEKVNGNALVTGHSLGGALSHYTAIDNPDLVKGAFTFSAPGIAKSYGDRWKILKKDEMKPLIYNFNQSEDKIPTFGQSFVGKQFKVICAVDTTVNKRLVDQRRIHSKVLFRRNLTLLCKIKPQPTMVLWKQRALSVIPFVFAIVMTFLGRGLFGLYTSKPYASLFGPLRLCWRKCITEKYAAKYFAKSNSSAAAA